LEYKVTVSVRRPLAKITREDELCRKTVVDCLAYCPRSPVSIDLNPRTVGLIWTPIRQVADYEKELKVMQNVSKEEYLASIRR
jgi:hypothetical protein